MKKILFIILSAALLAFTGCGNKKQVLDKPDDLLSRNTMVNIIAESYIIESTVHTSADTVNRVTLAKLYYRDLFNRYHITRTQFETSLNYYISEESSAEKLLADAAQAIGKKREELGIPDTPSQPQEATNESQQTTDSDASTKSPKKHLSPTPSATDITE